MLETRYKVNNSVGEFSLEFMDEVNNKYAELGGTEAATFREPAADVNCLMFLNVGVQDSRSNIVDASTKVVPHMTYNAIEQEDG